MTDIPDSGAVRRFHRAIDADVDRSDLRPVEQYLQQFPDIADYVREVHDELARALAGEPELVAGRFEIRAQLGTGGQGDVFRAFDRRLRREVALKRVRLGTLGESLERFRREALHASKVNHPAVCRVLDAGVTDGAPWIAMEMLDGETLADRIARQRGDPPGPAAIQSLVRGFATAARGLAACHANGVVHRDVKPSNLMLTQGADGAEAMTVFDFGVARGGDDEEGDKLTAAGARIGTETYMSPEQRSGRSGEVDGRSDVYSLGMVVFEAVTGRCPVAAGPGTAPGAASSRPEVLDPRRLSPHVGRDLCAIIQRATENDPARRYRSAEELAVELEHLAAGRPIRARPVGPAGRWVRWARREPRLAAASAVAAVLLTVSIVLGVRRLEDADARQWMQSVRQREASADSLATAWLEYTLGRFDVARQQFAAVAVMAPGPDQRIDAHCGALLSAVILSDLEGAEALLDELRDDVSTCLAAQLEALCSYLRGGARAASAALADAPEPRTVLELTMAARLDLLADQAGSSPVPEATLRRALDRMLVAILSSRDEPRISAYAVAVQLANRIEDGRLGRTLSEALRQTWPDSGVAAVWSALALAGLEGIEPDSEGPPVDDGQRSADLEEALALLERACRLDPDLALAHQELGRLALMLGRLDLARAAFERALEIDDTLFGVHSNLGLLYESTGDAEAARAAHQAGLAIRRTDAGRVNFAALLCSTGDPEAALAVLEGPSDVDHLGTQRETEAIRHFTRGLILDHLGRRDDAIAALRRAIARHPGMAQAHNQLGTLLQESGDLTGALAAYRRSLDLRPTHAIAWINLGFVLQEQGDYAGALTALRKGHELGSSQPSWSHDSAAWIADCEAKLAAQDAPDPAPGTESVAAPAGGDGD